MECIKKYINAVIMPFNYLFYKLYVFYLVISSGDTPSGMSHLGVMGALIACNIITLYLTIWGYFPPIWIYAISFFLIIIPYASPKVAEKIVSKYENEQENSRIIGNIVVVIYIILSVVSLILVL